MTLEEELIKKGFKVFGPTTGSEIGESLSHLLKKSPQPVYFQIVHGKLARNDMNDFTSLYMIYYSSDVKLISS